MARPVLSVAALLDGVRPLATAGFVVTDAWDGRTSMPLVVNSLSRVESTLPPEHEERLLGIPYRTSFPGVVVRQLNDWLATLRANSRSNGVGPLTR